MNKNNTINSVYCLPVDHLVSMKELKSTSHFSCVES